MVSESSMGRSNLDIPRVHVGRASGLLNFLADEGSCLRGLGGPLAGNILIRELV